MNFWVVKSSYNNKNEEGWHWSDYLYEDCEGYDWGGKDWIKSKESQKYIREGVRKGDIVVCSQRGEGILGLTTLTGDGKDDPIGSGTYNLLPIAPSADAFVLDPILPIPQLRETGCNPRCFAPGRMGTVFPLDKEEFKGIIEAIINYYPEMGEDIINWLKRNGFEHQGEVPKLGKDVEFQIVKAELTVASIPGEIPSIDEYILELFFMNQVAWSDGEYSPMEEKYFYKCIPSEIYDGVMEKWSEVGELLQKMSDDEGIKYYEEMCLEARSKGETWKPKVIKNMIQMAKADRRIYPEELSTIAEIGDKIDIGEECRKQLLKEFDWDPYGVAGAKTDLEQRDKINEIPEEKKPGYEKFLGDGYEDISFLKEMNKKPGKAGLQTLRPIEKKEGGKPGNEPDPQESIIDKFRLGEELKVYKKVKSHPARKKLSKQLSEIGFSEGKDSKLKRLLKRGVRITRPDRESIFAMIENSFALLTKENPPSIEVFATRNPGLENAEIFIEERLPVFLFENDILERLNGDELFPLIGHEVGHLLLGHVDRYDDFVFVPIDELREGDELREMLQDPGLRDLIIYTCLLYQLRELSADRVGLLVSRNLDAFVSGLKKVFGGIIGGGTNTEEYIGQALVPEASDLFQTHPYGPHRSKALKIFSETDLYRSAIGELNGNPISEFSRILPQIIPYPEDELYLGSLIPQEESPAPIDDYVLEVLLYTLVALTDGKETPAEEKVIAGFVPAKVREEVLLKEEALYKDFDSKSDKDVDKFLKESYAEAAKKEKNWKGKVIRRMIKVAKSDRRIHNEELAKIAEIAGAIDAKEECSKQFLKEFGYDPFTT